MDILYLFKFIKSFSVCTNIYEIITIVRKLFLSIAKRNLYTTSSLIDIQVCTSKALQKKKEIYSY